MANIRVDSPISLFDGQAVSFKSPANCSTVTGLRVYYPEGDTTVSKVFQFADAHGNNVGGLDLFASNVVVKVILDVSNSLAFVQNADTNAYLEGELAKKYSPTNKPTAAELGVPTVAEMNAALANKKGAEIFTATIGTSWVENEDTGVKSQNVAISGVTANHTAKVDHSNTSVDGTSDGYATFVEEENQYLTYITNGYAETYNGGIKFFIFGDAPTIPIPIVVEVV